MVHIVVEDNRGSAFSFLGQYISHDLNLGSGVSTIRGHIHTLHHC